MELISLRGGGSACTNIKDQRKNIIHPKIRNDIQMIQIFIKNVSQRCENILKWSQKIGLQESKDAIIQEIKWFQLSSQYLNQIARETQTVQENIQLVFSNLEIILQAILNIIQTQSFLSYQLLKICNLFSQQIFIYYIYAPNPPMKLEKLKSYQNQLTEIEKYIEFGGQNFYQNSIIYEFEVIKMCINICPNDSTKGQEILVNTFKGILKSASQMSPSTELINAILDGVVYVCQKIKQKNQKKIFQVIFYLEQLKWAIIENIQNGISINSIRSSLYENYKKLINQQNEWIIQCSWIKFISEILQYTPTISREKYQKLKGSYNLNQDWIKLIESKLINPIDEIQTIATISNLDNGEQVGRMFKTWFIVLDQLKNICLNGYQDFPKFDIFVNEQQMNVLQEDKQQQFIKILEYVDNLQIPQLSNMYKNFYQNLLEYLQTQNSLQEDELDIVQQQLKVQSLITLSQKLDSQLQNLIINGNIINKQLDSFIQAFKNTSNEKQIQIINNKQLEGSNQPYNEDQIQKINQQHFYLLVQNYFIGIQAIGSKNCDITQEYSEFIKQFPNIKLNEAIKLLDQQNLFQNLINQSQNKDIILITSLLQENIHKIQQFNSRSSFMLKNYQGLMCQYIEVLVKFRKELMNQQNQLYYLEQTIICTNQKISYCNSGYRQNIIYCSILSHIIQMFDETNEMLSEINLNEQEIKEFKFLLNADIISILNEQINQEIEILTSYNIDEKLLNLKEDQITKKTMQQILINLQTQKKIQQNQHEQLESFQTQVKQYKQQIQFNMEGQRTQGQQYKQMLIQNGITMTQLMEQGNQRQDLIKILDERRKLLQNIQSDENDNENLNKQITEELQFTQILDQDQFYDFIEKKKQVFLDNFKQSNNQIISYLDEEQKEDKQNQNADIMIQIIEILDQITSEINQSFTTNYDESKKLLDSQNLLIFDIQNLLFSKQQISEDQQKEIKQEYFKYSRKYFDFEKISQLIGENSCLINQLPQISIYENQLIIIDKTIWETDSHNLPVEQSKNLIENVQDVFRGDSWRYKEYFYFSCLHTYSIVINKEIKQQLGRIILLGKFKETDFRIRSTLKNKEYRQQIELLINNEWNNSKEKIQISLQRTLNQLQAIQLDLQSEERKIQRENLIKKHKEIEQQLEQQMKNVNEIGDIIGITIYFMKDIQKGLIAIQSKLDNIIDSLNQMGQDIKYLRGKTPQQLLEIRMEQVLQNKSVQDLQSVYVQIQVKEYNIETMKEEENTHLFNYDEFQDGEIDEFIKEYNKTSLLIHGPAGSGKSTAARKIEEYLWIQYKNQANGQIWNQNIQLIIPIFIQLPTLKEPQFEAIEETLQSSIYKFDSKQYNLFLDQIQNSQIRLIFIMDSYDELANQYIGTSLIQTNKLYQWKYKNQLTNPKVITTSRSEIFSNTDYRIWFWENDTTGIQSYKEIKLQPFNNSQREEFLWLFSQLQLKLYIKELLEIIIQESSQEVILQESLRIFDECQINKGSKGEYLLDYAQIQQLIKIINENPKVINLNQEQETQFIKQIQTIWSIDQYQQSIKQMEIEDILETPFLLNIVVQVIPQMSEYLSSQQYIKESFKLTYLQEKKSQIKSIVKRYKANNQYIKLQYQQQQIDKLQKILDKNDEIVNESTQIWNCLFDSNFFKSFSVIQQIQEIITSLQKSNQLNQILKENTTNQERVIDNQLIIYKALTYKKSTIFEFYKSFLNHYTEKQRSKYIYSNYIKDQNQFIIDLDQFSTKLAVMMTLMKIATVEYKPMGVLFKSTEDESPFTQFFDDQDSYGNYRKLIRKCLPMKQKAYYYSFNHKTIQEYLFAKDVIDFFISLDQTLDQLVQIKQINTQQNFEAIIKKLQNCSLNQINLSKPQQFGIFKFIQSVIKTDPDLEEICYKLSLISSNFGQLITLSSNALYILAKAKMQINNRDFGKINVQNINLDGVQFIRCNFSESKFIKVSLNSTHFTKTNLSKVNWIDCYTNDLPILNAKYRVNDICYSLDGKQILGCGQLGLIWIWDRLIIKQIKSFKAHKNEVFYISQIKNNMIISFGQDDSKMNIKLWNSEFNQIGGDLFVQDMDFDFNFLEMYQEDRVDLDYRSYDFFVVYKQFKKLNQNFTHNHKYIATISEQNIINLYSIQDQKLVYLQRYEQQFSHIKILQNNEQIYCVSLKSQEILILNITDKNSRTIKFSNFITKIEQTQTFLSEDCSLLYFFNKTTIHLLNLQSEQHFEYKLQFTCDAVMLTPDNKYFAYICATVLLIYDTKSLTQLSSPQFGHKHMVTQMKFNQKQTEIITSSLDVTIKFWDLKMLLQKQQGTTSQFQQIKKMQYSPDGRTYLWFVLRTGEQIDQISLQFSEFHVCHSGKYIYFLEKDVIYQYDLIKEIFQKDRIHFTDQYQKLSYVIMIQSQDSKQFGVQYKYVNDLIPGQGQILFQIDTDIFQVKDYQNLKNCVYSLFDQVSKLLFYIDSIHINEIKTIQITDLQLQFPKFVHENDILQFLVKSDGKHMISSLSYSLNNEFFIQMWDIQKIEQLYMIKLDSNQILQELQLSFDNKYLMALCQNQNICFYETEQLKVIYWDQETQVEFQQFVANPAHLQYAVLYENSIIKIYKIRKQPQNTNNSIIVEEKIVIPKYLIQKTKLNHVNLEESKISSHLEFDLGYFWNQQMM